MFSYKINVRLHQTDAAGRLFFGQIFMIAHDVFQEFLGSLGLGIASILNESGFIFPVVHAEADYKRPIFVDEILTINAKIEKLGPCSFTTSYQIFSDSGERAGTVKIVHVAVERLTGKKAPLPSFLKDAFQGFMSKESV
ncbi:acyl-CoA thioesterase [bacterium]|nr:acyl-CoA thioesterase [bacterium]